MTARRRRRRRSRLRRQLARAHRRVNPQDCAVVTTLVVPPAPKREWALVMWDSKSLSMLEPLFFASRREAEAAAPRDLVHTVVDISKAGTQPHETPWHYATYGGRLMIEKPYAANREAKTGYGTWSR